MTRYEYLAHHGILGQKWGIRRFQNYDGTLKVAGKQRKKDSSDSEKTKEKKQFNKKKALAIAGSVATVAAIGAIGYYAVKNNALDKVVENGHNYVSDSFGSAKVNSFSSLFDNSVDKMTDEEKIEDFFAANELYGKRVGSKTNCIACALQSVLSDAGVLGYKANDAVDIDPFSGMVTEKTFSLSDVAEAFPGTSVKALDSQNWEDIREKISGLGEGASGIIGNTRVNDVGLPTRHAIKFTVKNGVAKFSDNQAANALLTEFKKNGFDEQTAKSTIYSRLSNLSDEYLNSTSIFDSDNDVKFIQIDNAKSVNFDALHKLLSK